MKQKGEEEGCRMKGGQEGDENEEETVVSA